MTKNSKEIIGVTATNIDTESPTTWNNYYGIHASTDKTYTQATNMPTYASYMDAVPVVTTRSRERNYNDYYYSESEFHNADSKIIDDMIKYNQMMAERFSHEEEEDITLEEVEPTDITPENIAPENITSESVMAEVPKNDKIEILDFGTDDNAVDFADDAKQFDVDVTVDVDDSDEAVSNSADSEVEDSTVVEFFEDDDAIDFADEPEKTSQLQEKVTDDKVIKNEKKTQQKANATANKTTKSTASKKTTAIKKTTTKKATASKTGAKK